MMEHDHVQDGDRSVDVSAAEFKALFETVSNWGRWGEDDERGALNYLTPDRVAAAVRLVRSGETTTLSLPLNTKPGIDNPEPADHRMTMLNDEDIGSGTLRFAKDYIGVDYHNDGHSHIDALCHVAFDGSLYNGKPSGSVTREGATVNAIDVVKDGIVGRGVLLDVPRLRGVPWLEPGEHIFSADLEEAERAQGVTVTEGDILLVRTGHARRLRRAGSVGHGEGQGGPAPDRCAVPGGAADRSARIRREQRHRAQHHRGHGLPDSRLDAQRDGRPPPRLPAVRGSLGSLRARGAMGVPVRRGTATGCRRDRIASQPAGHPVTIGSPATPMTTPKRSGLLLASGKLRFAKAGLSLRIAPGRRRATEAARVGGGPWLHKVADRNFDHVVSVMFENRSFDNSMARPTAR